MPKMTDRQLITILRDTYLHQGWDTIWNTLTPKQRKRAEMLVEKDDDRELTWPKLKRGHEEYAPLHRTSLKQGRKTY